MIRVGRNRLLVLNGRTIVEVQPSGGARTVWDESLLYSVVPVDVFNISLRHWSRLSVEVGGEEQERGGRSQGVFLREWAMGKPEETSEGGGWRIPILGLRLALEELELGSEIGEGDQERREDSSILEERGEEEDHREYRQAESQGLESMSVSLTRELPSLEPTGHSQTVFPAPAPPPQPPTSMMFHQDRDRLPLRNLFRSESRSTEQHELSPASLPHFGRPPVPEGTPDLFSFQRTASISPPSRRYLRTGRAGAGGFVTQMDIEGGELCSLEIRQPRGSGGEQSLEAKVGMGEEDVRSVHEMEVAMGGEAGEGSHGSSGRDSWSSDWSKSSVGIVPVLLRINIER